ncbi:hypothetical protein [Mesorhizobium sp. B2-2-3]|uniref:hypothetical protein n=1 Tax=Mesorhizobium sp. B2-2-3 TaxID=2589963 RepID=UPI0015E2A33F|nr:hypothetical protein [Mesorhizobium sp. B2-2-3]
MTASTTMGFEGASLLGEPAPEFVRIHTDRVFHTSVEVNISVEFQQLSEINGNYS